MKLRDWTLIIVLVGAVYVIRRPSNIPPPKVEPAAATPTQEVAKVTAPPIIVAPKPAETSVNLNYLQPEKDADPRAIDQRNTEEASLHEIQHSTIFVPEDN